MPEGVYSGFDAIVCITLEDAYERHKHTEAVMTTLGIPFTFYKAKRSVHGGRYGCFESHVSVCRWAYERGMENVLIFEDDVIPTPGYREAVIADVCKFIKAKENDGWERLQLGYGFMENFTDFGGWFRMMKSLEVTENIIRFCGSFTHAMCISRRGMKKIIDAAPAEMARGRDVDHVDMWMNRILSRANQYCTCPMMFDQRWSFPTTNVSKNWFEREVLRRNAEVAEKWAVFYWISMCRRRRGRVFTVMFLVMLLICWVVFWLVMKNLRKKQKV